MMKNLKIGLGIFRAEIYIILLLSIFIDEFWPLQYAIQPIIYQQIFSVFRVIDFFVLAVFVQVVIHKAVMARRGIIFKTPITLPLALFASAIILSIPITLLQGSINFFFAWKNLFLGALFFYSFINVFINLSQLKKLFWVLFSAAVVKSAFGLILYFTGRGFTTTEAGYSSFMNAPSIDLFSVMLISGVGAIIFNIVKKRNSLFVVIADLILFLGVLFSLRRINWAILAIGLIILFFFVRFKYRLKLIILGVSVAVAGIIPLIFSGYIPLDTFINRLGTVGYIFDSFSATSSNTATTPSPVLHVLDIMDAIDVIKANPLLGIGPGGSYETTRIREWKEISYGVHNGFLDTWIKYGILGAISYFWLFLSFMRYGYKYLRSVGAEISGLCFGPLAGGIAIFTMSFLFAPSTFGNFQSSVLLFFCMAFTFCPFVFKNNYGSGGAISAPDKARSSVNN